MYLYLSSFLKILYKVCFVTNLIYFRFQNLSLVEREPYEEMARQFKNDPNLRGGKLASDGTRVEVRAVTY